VLRSGSAALLPRAYGDAHASRRTAATPGLRVSVVPSASRRRASLPPSVPRAAEHDLALTIARTWVAVLDL